MRPKCRCGKIAGYWYGPVIYKLSKTDNLEVILEWRRLSSLGLLVDWHGEQVTLKDICEMHGKDYEEVRRRHNTWTNSSVYAAVFYDENPYLSFELIGSGGVIYQFSSQQGLIKFLGCVAQRAVDYLPLCNGSLVKLKQLIADHKHKETKTLYTIDGVSKFREEWIAFYETSEQRVQENMKKYKLPFEEAVKIPPERVRRLLVNKEEYTVREMWKSFGLDPKATNSYKSLNKLTYLETLRRKGVDITGITISPL